MGRILALILLIGIIIWGLIYFDVLALTPEGQQALDNAQDTIGEAASDTGDAIQDVGEAMSE